MSRIKDLRKEKGFTQAHLAKLLGVARSTVSMWESSPQEPDNDTLGKIADVFGVTTDYLLGRTDDRTFTEAVPHEKYREYLAGPGLRLLLDADANLTEDQLNEIIDFIEFKRRNDNR